MRNRLKVFLFFVFYWIVFMISIRAMFLIYNYDLSSNLTSGEILKVFLYGLKMDASMSSYIIMYSTLLLAISCLIKANWIPPSITIVNIAMLFLGCIVAVVDMELYRHWGFRLNTTPFFYIGPEAMGSINILVLLKGVFILCTLFTSFLFIYLRLIHSKLKNLKVSTRPVFTVLLVLTGLVFIPIRGSFSVAPMNTGFVYFHKTKTYANHAAINALWNFLNSVIKGSNVIYSESFFDKKLALKYFNELYEQGDSTKHLLKVSKPNILIVILESFTADVIEPLGGRKDIAPNLSQLCKEGILFTNFYGNGDRTDKGIVSVLSGYPAQPQSSIIKYPAKAQNLPFVSRQLNQLGYHSSFVYGGDIDFANFRSYLTNCQFENITSVDNFPDSLYTSKWGIHDEYIFDQTLKECDSSKSPFFKTMLSLSSHEPFDVPMKPFIDGNDDESLFLNACHYTDNCIGNFISKAKLKPWWDSTLIIFVADHGHRYPGNKELKTKERFRIPMLWIGGALVKQDTIIETFSSQMDIANTLLAQVDKPSLAFNFSKNILANQVNSFAVYFFNDGYGFVRPEQYIIFDNTGKQFLKQEGANQKDLDVSKAFQQILFEDYNKR